MLISLLPFGYILGMFRFCCFSCVRVSFRDRRNLFKPLGEVTQDEKFLKRMIGVIFSLERVAREIDLNLFAV